MTGAPARTTSTAWTTVGRVLHERAAALGDADFVVTEHERLTYAGADERSRVLARALIAAGVGKGARVALLYPTGIPFVVAALAVTRIGAVVVPISTFSKADEIRDILGRSACSVLVGLTAYRGNDYVAALRAGCGVDVGVPDPVGSAEVPSLRRVHLDGVVEGGGVDATHSLDGLLAGAA